MKIFRFLDSEGLVQTGAELPNGDRAVLEGDIYTAPVVTNRRASARQLLAPIAPSQILGIGTNYRKPTESVNTAEAQFPTSFMKGLNAVQHPGEPIVLPSRFPAKEILCEGELAVVIGRDCRNASRSSALGFVLGYTCGNDVTARDYQRLRGGGQWCRGKSCDTFCPLGPYIVTRDEVPDPGSLRIRTSVNGMTCQDGSTAGMIFSVEALIEALSASTTLPRGTVILTGAPPSATPEQANRRLLQAGDAVTVEIDCLGQLMNPVVCEAISS